MSLFNCKMDRACKSCLDRLSQKKASSTDINLLKRKPANECHQMLPYFEDKYQSKQKNVDFKSAREF